MIYDRSAQTLRAYTKQVVSFLTPTLGGHKQAGEGFPASGLKCWALSLPLVSREWRNGVQL